MAEPDARSRPEVDPSDPPPSDPLTSRVEEFAALASGCATIDVEDYVARCPEGERDELRRRCLAALAIQATLRRHLHDGRPPRARDALAAGTEVGEFTIDHDLGPGPGGGVQYLARQPAVGRLVTLTVFGGTRAVSDETRRQIRRAATSAARLRHPAIVPIVSTGEADGRPFVASACLEGHTLAALLRDDRRAWPGEAEGWQVHARNGRGRIARIAEIAADLGEALQYAHEAGLVHGNLHPASVLLDREGRAHLDAFGLASEPAALAGDGAADTSDALAEDDALHYLSPEQARGPPAAVGPRSDVFALGVLLYEMLTRARPFEGVTRQRLLAAIARDEAVPVRRVDPDVPRDLETICHAALAKRPARRYATMGAFADDLRRFLEPRAIHARPPAPLARARQALARHRTAATVVVLLAVAAVVPWLVLRWAA